MNLYYQIVDRDVLPLEVLDGTIPLRAYIPGPDPIEIPPGGFAKVRTGICLSLEQGFEAHIRTCRKLANINLIVTNSPGTVSASCKDELYVLLSNLNELDSAWISDRDIIALMSIQPVLDITLVGKLQQPAEESSSSAEEAAAMFSYSAVARSAYAAYSASTGNLNFQGNQMPDWFELPEKIKTAWEASVRQVLMIADNGSGCEKDFPDPQRWSHWRK